MKKVHAFVATAQTQGQRENDFCFVPEGELLTFHPITCTNEQPDGHCGCCRSMGGVITHKSTTTMKVVEVDREEVGKAIVLFFREAGWSRSWNAYEEYEAVQDMVKQIVETASAFPVGTIVELRGDEFEERSIS